MIEIEIPIPSGFIGARIVLAGDPAEYAPIPPKERIVRKKGETAFDDFRRMVSDKRGGFTSDDFSPAYPVCRASEYLGRLAKRGLIVATDEKIGTNGRSFIVYTNNQIGFTRQYITQGNV